MRFIPRVSLKLCDTDYRPSTRKRNRFDSVPLWNKGDGSAVLWLDSINQYISRERCDESECERRARGTRSTSGSGACRKCGHGSGSCSRRSSGLGCCSSVTTRQRDKLVTPRRSETNSPEFHSFLPPRVVKQMMRSGVLRPWANDCGKFMSTMNGCPNTHSQGLKRPARRSTGASPECV